MTRTGVVAIALGVSLAGPLGAQSSQFGVRGLGLPSLPVSARSHGAGGALGFFDQESSINPASVIGITRPTASFNVLQSWRSSENPYGDATGRDTHFPLFFAGGSINSRMSGSLSASVYTDRTFGLAFQQPVELRGESVLATDTLTSKGGITDLRGALAYAFSPRLVVGVGLHLLTGINRVEYRRHFDDSAYAAVRLVNEVSYSGAGVSLGAMAEPIRSRLQLAGFVRFDGDLGVDRNDEDTGELSMPQTLGVAAQLTPSRRLILAAHLIRQSWSRMDQDLRERDGAGAVNTQAAAFGLEWLRDGERSGRFPIRAGVRWAELPFRLTTDDAAGREYGVSIGTGFLFAGGRGTFDLALERVWRDEGAFTERMMGLKLGIGLRQ